VNPLDFPLLTDENIQPTVVSWLCESGRDVRTVFDEGLNARSDVEILARAHTQGRIVLTHDSDFGRLAILRGDPLIGILYLRPGHRDADFTIGTLRALHTSMLDVTSPFIIVAERRGNETRVRVRTVRTRGGDQSFEAM
jgi:predicted nuclease of predicted toxin-antitoxin system